MSLSRKVLVTGASGFVGRALCASLVASGDEIRGAVRVTRQMAPAGVRIFEVGEIAPYTDWEIPLTGAEAVVHCAAWVKRTSPIQARQE